MANPWPVTENLNSITGISAAASNEDKSAIRVTANADRPATITEPSVATLSQKPTIESESLLIDQLLLQMPQQKLAIASNCAVDVLTFRGIFRKPDL